MSILDKVNETIVKTLITDLAEYIADAHGLDQLDVATSIERYLGRIARTPPPTEKMPTSLYKSVSIRSPQVSTNKCSFIVTRGPHKDKACGTIIRGGGEYCSKHLNG